MVPMIVTDNPHMAHFVPWGMRVELISDVDKERARAPDLDWSHYQVRQFDLIGRRWQPSSVVTFGVRPPEACLQAIRQGANRPL